MDVGRLYFYLKDLSILEFWYPLQGKVVMTSVPFGYQGHKECSKEQSSVHSILKLMTVTIVPGRGWSLGRLTIWSKGLIAVFKTWTQISSTESTGAPPYSTSSIYQQTDGFILFCPILNLNTGGGVLVVHRIKDLALSLQQLGTLPWLQVWFLALQLPHATGMGKKINKKF